MLRTEGSNITEGVGISFRHPVGWACYTAAVALPGRVVSSSQVSIGLLQATVDLDVSCRPTVGLLHSARVSREGSEGTKKVARASLLGESSTIVGVERPGQRIERPWAGLDVIIIIG